MLLKSCYYPFNLLMPSIGKAEFWSNWVLRFKSSWEKTLSRQFVYWFRLVMIKLYRYSNTYLNFIAVGAMHDRTTDYLNRWNVPYSKFQNFSGFQKFLLRFKIKNSQHNWFFKLLMRKYVWDPSFNIPSRPQKPKSWSNPLKMEGFTFIARE